MAKVKSDSRRKVFETMILLLANEHKISKKHAKQKN